MNITEILSKELNLSKSIIEKVLELFKEGGTIPFVARYRKEATGNLDEVQLINIKDRQAYWEGFVKRKETILQSIASQGKLTPELESKIKAVLVLTELEDLYLPYKQKRKSKGEKAIEQGLKPLAIFIQKNRNLHNIEDKALSFVKGEIENDKEALDGAVNILAEWIAEDKWVRDQLRNQFQRFAVASSKVKRGKKEEGEKYKDYFEFSEKVQRMASHRVLALFRAEKEGVISFSVDVDEEKAIQNINNKINRNYASNTFVDKAVTESYKRILQPNFESEIKKELKEKADIDSIGVFAENLKQLLLQSPLGAKNILAIDPGFRSGCKVAVLNRNGDFTENTTIFPHPPQNKMEETKKTLLHLVEKNKIEAIAIGNGTAGLETEKLCRGLFKEAEIQVFSVNEAGASIYSASEIARDEFPELDLTVRGAISIGRRLIDPLAELVKIDAKSIGVGQYQHDVNQPLLKQKLNDVVASCVNHVGVELNTASYPILSHVSGLGMTLAKNIVAYREENGDYTERKQLLKVPKMGKKTYEQAAGFLRIENGINPLDNTIIHPETYKLVSEMLQLNSSKIDDVIGKQSISDSTINSLKEKYDGYTIDFIVKELQKPTIDPRESLVEAAYNSIDSIEDLQAGMQLTGTINNITNFGAFVNIGIKESGLVHISEISNTFVTNIQDVVKLNQQVDVKVLSVDLARKRVQLSMKS
ncbi:MAG: RNA-binding transcriptional accessory protein [Flavobacteriales bacterium]|nr:MAG: RNA-binding transcriptional accessory protein [Flavobacteriales bacterium]